MTLADFLLARTADDEAVAEGAKRTSGPSWHAAGLQSPFDARMDDHIARHDPARVLAECEAKRRIVEIHGNGDAWCDYCAGYAEGMQDECHTGRLLALPYADHPDYREEWKP